MSESSNNKEYVKRLDRTQVYNGNIIECYSDKMKLPNGKIENWDFVHHKNGAACVLPVLEDGRIILVHQYRPALNRMTWEVPAGCRDAADEPTEITAARELTEETGYKSGDIAFLLSLKSTVAFCDELIDVYLARDLSPGEQHLDEAEVIDIKAWTMEAALEEIYSGRIQDSKTVSAILAYEAKRLSGKL
ncbi:MAG: NUDIX hydrolase [Lachnospiraceae bacterium]|nr:NUDIX hydrolase [Lachnospiraceae bacterium]